MLLDFRLSLACARWARELCSETSGELLCVHLQFLYALCCLHAAIFTPSFCRFWHCHSCIPTSLYTKKNMYIYTCSCAFMLYSSKPLKENTVLSDTNQWPPLPSPYVTQKRLGARGAWACTTTCGMGWAPPKVLDYSLHVCDCLSHTCSYSINVCCILWDMRKTKSVGTVAFVDALASKHLIAVASVV